MKERINIIVILVKKWYQVVSKKKIKREIFVVERNYVLCIVSFWVKFGRRQERIIKQDLLNSFLNKKMKI